MLVYFTDAVNGKSVAINPEHVVAVFEATEGEHKDKTVISIGAGGTLVTEESQLDVVGKLNGELN